MSNEYDSLEVDSIQNYLIKIPGALRFFTESKEKIYNKVFLNKISLELFLQQKLGKESYCWTGYKTKTYHVWQYENYVVLANNEEGISFEVKIEMSAQTALSLYKNFLNLLGIE